MIWGNPCLPIRLHSFKQLLTVQQFALHRSTSEKKRSMVDSATKSHDRRVESFGQQLFKVCLYGGGSKPIIINSNGMNIHLPAILGFTRCQGFDPIAISLRYLKSNNMDFWWIWNIETWIEMGFNHFKETHGYVPNKVLIPLYTLVWVFLLD